MQNLNKQNIPDGWKIIDLSKVALFLDNQRIPISSEDRSSRQGEYPYYGASGIIDHINDYLFDGEFVLLGEDGANIIDRSSRLAFIAKGKIWVNNHAHILEPKPNIKLYFLSEYLERLKYDRYNTGSAQPKLNRAVCEKIPIYLPPLSEQNRIVSVLETWDKVIEKLEKKIEIKKKIKKGLADEYIFNSKNTDEYFIRDLFDLGRGRVISKGEIEKRLGIYPVYSSQTSSDGIFGKINSFDFEGEYLTWTTDGANAGRVYYRDGRFNCTNVCGTARLKKGNKVNLYYAASYLNHVTKTYVSYVGNPKLMNGVFGQIKIKLPKYEAQCEIAHILITTDKEIKLMEKKLKNIREQKKYLLNNLITGAIRTPENLKIN